VASRKGTLYRFGIADSSQESIEFPETPDALRDKNAYTLDCATRNGATFVRLLQPVASGGVIPKHVQLYSFTGKRWSIVLPGGGEAVGVAISQNERDLTVVCTDMVYTIDTETGRVTGQRHALWCTEK
jgi:hypothetical protein